MSTRVATDRPRKNQLRVVLRQAHGEVATFIFFVLAIIGALLLFVPQPSHLSAPLLALAGVAVAWSALTLTASETYLFDSEARTVSVHRAWLLGNVRQVLAIPSVQAVQQVVRGVDDDRRQLELVAESDKVRLRLPRRFNTLGASVHENLGRQIADHLGITLRRQ